MAALDGSRRGKHAESGVNFGPLGGAVLGWVQDFLILAALVFVRSKGDDDAGTDGDSAVFRAAPADARCLVRSVTS